MSYKRFVELFLQYKQEEKCDSNRKQEQGVKKGVNIGIYIDMDSITLKIGSQSQTGRAGSLETPPLKPGPGNWPAREKIVCRKRQFEERERPRFAGKAVGQWLVVSREKIV